MLEGISFAHLKDATNIIYSMTASVNARKEHERVAPVLSLADCTDRKGPVSVTPVVLAGADGSRRRLGGGGDWSLLC